MDKIKFESMIKRTIAFGLTEVDLSGKDISELPPEIFRLNQLISLNLSNNQLSSLPQELGQLKRLRYLNLDNNLLYNLPEEISQLENLARISLNNNQVKDISPILQLRDLIYLSIDNNKLTELPKEIGNLRFLRTLSVKGNELQTLPNEIRKITRLEFLFLEGNQLNIPPEILEKTSSPNSIYNFCFNYKKVERRPLLEAKIVFVGQGSVGKTSLINRLYTDKYNPQENKTNGITIQRWEVKNGEEAIKVNSWDFGGQEIMHATHQFFLTKRSLYILVLDSRLTQEENRVEYWLKIIQSFGGESPIIIVGNKIDQHPLDINKKGITDKYSQNLKAIIETSCLTGKGIRELRKLISNEINRLPHIHDELPLSWFNVKDRLASLDVDFIPFQEYKHICQSEGIIDPENQNTLIDFLHDLGVVLNFRDDPRLQDTNILNPEWVTGGVYSILNSNVLFQASGILDYADLGNILPPDIYPATRHDFIIEMMKKFELCYAFDTKERYLVPDLLSKDEPYVGEWDNTLTLQYHYPVLPSSIMSRFIVRMHPFVSKKTVWRTGVVLEWEGNCALVKADIEERCIFIYVKGENPRLALSAIRTQFASIHKTISSLIVKEKVPIPDHPELDPIDYQDLLTFETHNELIIKLAGKGKVVNVDVSLLLDGLEYNAKRQARIKLLQEQELSKSLQVEAANGNTDGDAYPTRKIPRFRFRHLITIAIIGFLLGILGNLVSVWIQQDVLQSAFTLDRLLIISMLVIILVVISAIIDSRNRY